MTLIQAAKIRKYVDDLGSDANAGEHADFVSACYDALRDDGDMELQEQALNTLAWRNKQISLIQILLKHLEHEGLLQQRNVVIIIFQNSANQEKVHPKFTIDSGLSQAYVIYYILQAMTKCRFYVRWC